MAVNVVIDIVINRPYPEVAAYAEGIVNWAEVVGPVWTGCAASSG